MRKKRVSNIIKLLCWGLLIVAGLLWWLENSQFIRIGFNSILISLFKITGFLTLVKQIEQKLPLISGLILSFKMSFPMVLMVVGTFLFLRTLMKVRRIGGIKMDLFSKEEKSSMEIGDKRLDELKILCEKLSAKTGYDRTDGKLGYGEVRIIENYIDKIWNKVSRIAWKRKGKKETIEFLDKIYDLLENLLEGLDDEKISWYDSLGIFEEMNQKLERMQTEKRRDEVLKAFEDLKDINRWRNKGLNEKLRDKIEIMNQMSEYVQKFYYKAESYRKKGLSKGEFDRIIDGITDVLLVKIPYNLIEDRMDVKDAKKIFEDIKEIFEDAENAKIQWKELIKVIEGMEKRIR